MAKPSDFSATLMAQLAIALAKEGVEPNDVDVLCARKNVLRAIPQLARGEAEVVMRRILTPFGIVKVDAQPKFVINDNYKLDTSSFAVVKIGYIRVGFYAWFGDCVEDEAPEAEIKYHRLERNARADEIFDELGDNTEVKLSQIFALMRKQPRGPQSKGADLLTNGHMNMFKVHTTKGEPCVVSVRWNYGAECWDVYIHPLIDALVWSANSRVFSRN